jgi:alkanesulfonate monooxygenase SsuD/methylene tetrahydromethanopterin reductase-like flavin-dependent oxidoreductase (luciferase family)
MLARTVASLSALSGGRIVLGLGAGGLLDRVTELGAPHRSPGAAVDAAEEAIILIRQLCAGEAPARQHKAERAREGGSPMTGEGQQHRAEPVSFGARQHRAEPVSFGARQHRAEPVTFAGRHYRVDRAEPAPVVAPPMWTGSVGPKSLAATGRVADGWIPGHAADWLSDRYRRSRPIINEAASGAGRAPRDIVTIFNFPGRITDRPLPATRGEDGRWIGGSPAQWVEELTGAVTEHGAGGFMLFSPSGGTPDPADLRRWATEIVPAVREKAGQRPG